ncbi:MAG: response regulator, partial [Thiotrichaceae bacterium]|nr:response regulator [Thiotrichaceae bacterium]
DDEMHVLRILRLSLEKQGYEVDTFNNGEDALKALEQITPDVLITDIEMPRMTGEELCKQIEIEYPDRNFLIIVLTSRTEFEHREWSSLFENLQFIEKPISMRKLIDQLGDYFALQNTF